MTLLDTNVLIYASQASAPRDRRSIRNRNLFSIGTADHTIS